MKQRQVFAVPAILGLGAMILAGCGGGVGSNNDAPPPSITSFTASPATITDGASAKLTAVFANGSGSIAPGNISVTSGTPVSLIPPNDATTTYTLTVTGSSGATASQTAAVQAVAAPTVTSFIASPATVAIGGSASLTAVFDNGAGVITPGNITVTSGTAIAVTPDTLTTYTLTVTNAANTAATQTATVTLQSTVTVDPTSPGIAVTDQLLGMNLGVFYDIVTNQTPILRAFQQVGIKAVRWPGGSASDQYHWATNTVCATNYVNSNATFANFVNDIAIPGGFDVALTADYGTNAACNGGGEPSEAAAWVAAALNDGITVSHMTVGNEEYGNWETDLHTKPNDAVTYASAVAGPSGYYDAIKAASPNTLVGIVVDADNTAGGWDETVLSNARGYYDFVELHYYPQAPGTEDDTYITQQGANDLTTNYIDPLKQELANAGVAATPIYMGEMGSVYSNPGKQTMSITQGIYAGQMLGEMMNGGVARATWWIGFGSCNGQSGNDSSSLYGWQDFGGYNVFSGGPADQACPWSTIGTPSPTGRAFQLFSNVAIDGEHVLTPVVTGDSMNVRAYSATHSGGTALVLFNVNGTNTMPVTVTVNGESNSPAVTVITYSKAIYDDTQNGNWDPPTTTNMGSQSLPLTLTLDPWSMNVVLIQ